MSTASLAWERTQPQREFRRLIGAEFLKLRRRRALLAVSIALIVGPMLASVIVLTVLHAANPTKYGPAGGTDNLGGLLGLLIQIGAVVAVLVGVNAGGGDLAAGVFRELVVTGRSRLALFAARIPGGLALLLPLVVVAFAIAATASVALAGSQPSPGPRLLLEYAGWVGLALTLPFLLALGLSSLLDSRAIAIGVLLAWQLAVAPLLLQSGKLDPFLLGAALKRLDPGAGDASISFMNAILLIVVWTLLPLAAGAWRTLTRDA